MDSLRSRFIDKVKELGKKSNLSDIEKSIKRYIDLMARSTSLTDVEVEEVNALGDSISSDLSQEILKPVSLEVEAEADEISSLVYKAIPRDSSSEIVKDIAEGIISDIKSGKYATIQEAIDTIYEDYGSDIREYILRSIGGLK